MKDSKDFKCLWCLEPITDNDLMDYHDQCMHELNLALIDGNFYEGPRAPSVEEIEEKLK